MKIVDNILLDKLNHSSGISKRKREMFCLHEAPEDTLHRMVNVMQPGTYLQPHKHSYGQKREVFVILKGCLLVCLFDDSGNITESIILDRNLGNFIAEIPVNTFHTIIPLSVNTSVFECKDGPYQPDNDKEFAPWAPAETESDALQFNAKLLQQLGLNFPSMI